MKANELGKLAAREREVRNVSLRTIAKRAHISPQSVSDVEQGRGSWKVSVSVLKALGIPKVVIRAVVLRTVVRELRLA